MANGDVHDQVSDQYLKQFDRSVGVSGMQKLQSFPELQKLGHAGTLSHQKEDFHGLQDFDSQMSKYSHVSHTLRIAWSLISAIVPNNPSIEKQLFTAPGLGSVGNAFKSIHGFGQVFSLSPSDLKSPAAVQSKASVYKNQSVHASVVTNYSSKQAIGGGASPTSPGNASSLNGFLIVGTPTSVNNTLSYDHVTGNIIWGPGGTGGGGGGSSTLADDTDVLLTSPSDGQFLVYNNGAGKWENHSLAAGDIPSLPESRITGLVTDLATLTSAIISEASTRASADTSEATARAAADTSEATARAAADALLQPLSGKDVASGYAGLTAGGLLNSSEFPAPTTSTFGGVKDIAAVSHQFVNAITSGVPQLAQPAYSDISGTPTLAQTKAAITSNWLRSYDATTGLFTASQPTFTDLSSHPTTLAGYGITDAVSSSSVFPSSITNVSHKWLNSYDATTGLFTQTQPDYSDISGTPQLAQTKAIATHQFFTSYDAGTGLFTAAQPAASDITGLATIATTGKWSDLQNATASLTLANGTNDTEFDQTSAASWTWKNTTAATVTVPQNSPILKLVGNYWTGSAGAADTWSIQDLVGVGTNGSSTLAILQSGSPVTSLVTTPVSTFQAPTVIGQNFTMPGLANVQPVTTNSGTPGSTTYTYQVIAKDSFGQTTGALNGTTSTGNASLSVGNFNVITWTTIAGAVSYDIYRSTSTGGLTKGKIANVLATYPFASTAFNDTGINGDNTTAPANNNAGGVLGFSSTNGAVGTISIGGYNPLVFNGNSTTTLQASSRVSTAQLVLIGNGAGQTVATTPAINIIPWQGLTAVTGNNVGVGENFGNGWGPASGAATCVFHGIFPTVNQALVTQNITSVTFTTTVATVTCGSTTGLVSGATGVVIAGLSAPNNTQLNGTWTITSVVNTTTFTVTSAFTAHGATGDTGTVSQQATGNYTVFKVNVTETATGGTATSNKLIDLQTNTLSKFLVDSSGLIGVASGNVYRWSSTTDGSGTKDTGLSRSAAGVVAVGNGTASDFTGTIKAATHTTGTATWTSGTGSPEGVVTAVVGSIYTRTDGGSSTTLYVKETGAGNTGWVVPGGTSSAPAGTTVSTTNDSYTASQRRTYDLTMAKTFASWRITEATGKMFRLQLYSTSAARTADAARPYTVPLALGNPHGCIVDLLITQVSPFVTPWMASPTITGSNNDSGQAATIYAAVTSFESGTQNIQVTISYVSLES